LDANHVNSTEMGNSLGVRIPKAIAEQVNLQSGTPVDSKPQAEC